MSKIFLGKFSNKYPDQIQQKYYAAGPEGAPWYGEVRPGDYIFPAYEGKIIALWRAKEYTHRKNPVNLQNEGVLQFEEIKGYSDVSLTNHFTRYKHFIHDLNLVNKVVKSVKNLGFIPIATSANCPSPEDIEFKANTVNIYVALEDAKADYKDGDIRVALNNLEELRIKEIQRFVDNEFVPYNELQELYDERNKEDGKYTIRELNDYAIQDNATNKRQFLVSLIAELEKAGFYRVADPIKLYDHLLVGRKRSTITLSTPEPGHKDKEGIPLTEDEEYGDLAVLLNFNPNLILYGPPGTGKTFATQNIIDAFERNYYDKSGSFSQAKIEGRVKNITFHQSYSYEEFIEGIRPVLSDEQNTGVGYVLENGLFKEFCIDAEKELIKRKDNASFVDKISSASVVWKVSLGERKTDTLFNECLEKNEIAIGWLPNEKLDTLDHDEIYDLLAAERESEKKPTQNADTINSFVHEMKTGDVVLIYNSPETVRSIGIISSDYFYNQQDKEYAHRRKVEWLKDLTYPINIKSYNSNKILTLKTVYRLSSMTVSDIVHIINTHSQTERSLEDKHQVKPYYMIIDEINRGNISKIFGELITLIEQDKRGRETVLPYSKKEFTVPANLYIIGTMNTADRSIAALDTALRRRFTFAEIEPDSRILDKHDNPIVNDYIDLTKLMDCINKRIMEKVDRDHRIGHAYFMGIESLKGLYQTWYYKVLPLLNEYFYNDVSTLESIVGKSFYDPFGNVKYLSLEKKPSGHSEFEERLSAIYLEQGNG